MPAPSSAKRILVRGVNWLGDAVMSMPALERLREARPNDHIALLTAEKIADLWRNHPAFNEVITFSGRTNPFSTASRLRRMNFDIALLLPNSPRAALEAWMAEIPTRVGYARPWRNFLLTRRVPPRLGAVLIRPFSHSQVQRAIQTNLRRADFYEAAHHLYDYLNLVSILGAKPIPSAPRIPISNEEIAQAEQRLNLPRPPGGWFGLNPGAEYGPAKRWPAGRFVAAALELHQRTRCGWIVLGGKHDRALAEEVTRGIQAQSTAPAVNLAGKTTLRELCASFKLCRVVITNDTGPMHVAAAVGAPVVVPFGSTSPTLTGPGLPGEAKNVCLRANVPCSPCFRRTCPVDFRCMLSIKTEQVVEAALRMAGS